MPFLFTSAYFRVEIIRSGRHHMELLHRVKSSAAIDRKASLHIRAAIIGLVFALTLTYWHSFTGPFVFDDLAAIPENASLRHIADIFSPPSGDGVTVGGRPVLNASLALNYALGGINPWGYHAGNFLIHTLSTLLIFGFVRGTLTRPRLQNDFGNAVTPLAFFIALLWALHPLQTESVTYIIQRAESLAALFYIFTLYCFVRGIHSPHTKIWFGAAVFTCLLGMGTKETVVSAPLLVLLYDRVFVAGSLRAAWRQRKGFYGALGATWILLIILIASTDHRGGTAGFGLAVTPWHYLLTQCRAIVHYLTLVFWPEPLVFDYGMIIVKNAGEVIWQAMFLLTLLGATLLAWLRRPMLGWVGLFFFAVLAPSSSFVPVASQTMAEHRMYLPLLALISLFVLTGYRCLGHRSFLIWPVTALALSLLTVHRNADYRSAIALWTDTVKKQPDNARAHNNLSALLLQTGKNKEALIHAREAVRLSPNYAEAHSNLGFALASENAPAETLEHYEAALHLKPDSPVILTNAGMALTKLHRLDEAKAHYEKALALNPNYAPAHNNLGNLLADQGHFDNAVLHYQKALALDPVYAEAAYNLGSTLLEMKQLPAAIGQLEHALQLRPAYAEAHYALGNAFADMNRADEAIAHYKTALQINPGFAEAQNNWGNLFLKLDQPAEAIKHYEAALKIRTGYPDAHNNLANALMKAGRENEAIAHYEAAIAISANNADAHYNLGNVYLGRRRLTEAVSHYEAALQQKSTAGAEHNLGLALASLGRVTDALPHFQSAVQLAPDSSEARYNYARALAQSGRIREAMAEDEAALRLNPDFNEAREHLRLLQR